MGMAYITPLEKMATHIPVELIEKFTDSES